MALLSSLTACIFSASIIFAYTIFVWMQYLLFIQKILWSVMFYSVTIYIISILPTSFPLYIRFHIWLMLSSCKQLSWLSLEGCEMFIWNSVFWLGFKKKLLITLIKKPQKYSNFFYLHCDWLFFSHLLDTTEISFLSEPSLVGFCWFHFCSWSLWSLYSLILIMWLMQNI